MADPLFDSITAGTLADLERDVVIDNFFVGGADGEAYPILRTLRAAGPGVLDSYTGGSIMQSVFMYDRVNGGAIPPGSNLNVTQKQIISAMAFSPKEYVEQVPLNLWQTEVINSGPNAMVKTADAYMANAVMSCNTDLNIDFYRHGQASGGAVVDDRSIFINGASEFCNDGVNPSWDGNVFTTVGGQSRNGAVGNTLNSIPVWAGDANGNTGQVSYKLLLEGYLNCVQAPDTGVCNKALFAYLLERQETKQRFAQETNARIGLTGIKILDAYIHYDKLCPSTKYGTILPSGLSQTTSISPSTFTSPTLTAAQTAISNMPSAKTLTPGEVFFWFRLKGWKIRPSSSPEYDHNFTPPIRTQNNADLIVMFYKVGINCYTIACRDNWQCFGIGF